MISYIGNQSRKSLTTILKNYSTVLMTKMTERREKITTMMKRVKMVKMERMVMTEMNWNY